MNAAEQPLRADVLARVQEKIEKALPDQDVRRGALELLAYAIENADDERSDGWTLRESSQGLVLVTARVLACRIKRGTIEISVMGPVADDVRAEIGADQQDGEEWKAVPGGLFLSFPADKAKEAHRLLKDAFDKFVDEAMGRMRRAVSQERHLPEAVAYVSSVVGRSLPQPSEAVEPSEDESPDDDDSATSREPKIRGRAPIFNHAQMSIASLIGDIEQKTMALPDLQRPFVWEDTKVRDLLDSLFVGFPVGTLVLWQTSDGKDAHALGGPDALKANTLIIDGQQRLTSLYAVMRGAEITERDGTKRRIKIAFRPRDGRFEVADAAISNDPEFLSNVNELWSTARTKGQIRRELLQKLEEKGRTVDEAYRTAVEENLDRAQAISDYQFPVVKIQKTSGANEANEEDVAEIFVRINNQGKRLGQADFVLTLLSVFHERLRDRIEQQATEMSRGAVLEVDTQQLLRATCAVAFHRARMSAVYKYLRGVDPVTGDASPKSRQERLDTMDRAAGECIDSTTWRDYMLRVMHAGFVSQGLIASNAGIVNAYAFYVIGRRLKVSKPKLDESISRWLFGSLLSARYSASSETIFEQDLARTADLKPGQEDAFVAALDEALSEKITGDYWTHTVVAALETQRSRAPAALAFRAAQIVLGARALFSDQPMRNLLAPPGDGKRAASEAHHLFPRAWLLAHGVTDRRRINQVANLADVGWYENVVIGARRPSEYVPRLREKLGLDDDKWGRACAEHALPLGWEKLEYDAFLRERRQRMAEMTRVAFRQLGGEADSALLTPPWFLPGAEQVWRRIGETERALRVFAREVYSARFGGAAARKIEEGIPERERESVTRALRARPAGADPLSVVDYLYMGQFPALLFASDVQQETRARLHGVQDPKPKLIEAIEQIGPVRNEIAHVREVGPDRLQRANVACADVLGMLNVR